MSNTKKLLKADQYRIAEFINPEKRKLIENDLDISSSTFFRKMNVKVSELGGGFTILELKRVADILERDMLDLLSDETKIYYGFVPSENFIPVEG